MTLLSDVISAINPQQAAATQYNRPKRDNLTVALAPLGETHASFVFTEFEVPELLDIGMQQRHAEHEFIGGGKAIDLFGTQYSALMLRGELFNLDSSTPQTSSGTVIHNANESAMQRMQRLAKLVDDKKPLTFYFHTLKFVVTVTAANFQPHNWNHVSYTMQLSVLSSNILSLKAEASAQWVLKLNPDPPTTFFRQVQDFMKTSTSFMTQVSSLITLASTVGTALKTNPASILFRGAAILPSTATYASILSSSATAMTALITLYYQTHPQLVVDLSNAQPYDTLAPDAVTRYLQPGISNYRSQLSDASSFFFTLWPAMSQTPGATLSNMLFRPGDPYITSIFANDAAQTSAHLRRMYYTSSKMVQPARTRFIVYKDPDLTKIALQMYGDPEKWQDLAKLNGLTSAINTGVYRLQVPYADDLAGAVTTVASTPNVGV